MAKVHVKLKAVGGSYTDISQGKIISGQEAVEVELTPKIDRAIKTGVLEKVSESEAKKHNTEVEKLQNENAKNIAAQKEKKEVENKSTTPANNDGYDDMDITKLSAIATEKGIKFNQNISAVKLIARLREFDTNGQSEDDTPEQTKEEYQKELSEKTDDELLKLAEENSLEVVERDAIILALVEKKFAE